MEMETRKPLGDQPDAARNRKGEKMSKPREDLTIEEMSTATGIKKTTLLYQIVRGYWRVRGRPAAKKRAGVWFIHPAASLVFPARRPGPGRPKGMKNK